MRYVHTCLRVLDLDRTIDFYTSKLGLELATRPPLNRRPLSAEVTHAFLAIPGDPEPRIELNFYHSRREPYDLGDGYSHVAFVVDDANIAFERLKEAGGVDFETDEPLDMPTGVRLFFIRDPDGYRVEFLQRNY
jgi:lactoylglutathione lyase